MGARQKRIVIAADSSPGSRLAVSQGVALAHDTGAAVTIVNVQPEAPRLSDAPLTGRAASPPGAHEARDSLEAAVAGARAAGVDASFQFLEGDPATEVVRFAREVDADLIVVGSRRLGSVRSLLLGSVSRALVDQADRPVLVVK